MMTNDRAMLDANLLVYAFYPKVPQHQPARQTLDQAQDENAGLCVTMLANGVKRIYTFNVKDFRPFPEIEAIEPKAP